VLAGIKAGSHLALLIAPSSFGISSVRPCLAGSRGAFPRDLYPPESSGAKSSIYALAVDPQGHTIVSGGPERVIRMWDPRASKRIGKLVGHTDNIRAVLLSDDSRCVRCSIFPLELLPHFLHKQLLTASADAMSASHIKVKISLMTGQPRSSSGLSPRSAACAHLHTIWSLSGCSTNLPSITIGLYSPLNDCCKP
jgi:WD40 repeat protein